MNLSNNKKEFRRKAILNDALLPLLVKTSIPTIIGMLVMVIYNLTDTFFVGILNNKSMTAAIDIVFSFMSFIQAIGFWFGYGSGNIMSKKIGENEEKEGRWRGSAHAPYHSGPVRPTLPLFAGQAGFSSLCRVACAR